MQDWKAIVEKLGLMPHPEGGFFKETYRSAAKTTIAEGKERDMCTQIYFMLVNDNVSNFHRIKHDEMWHFYSGCPLSIIVLDDKTKSFREIVMGPNIFAGHQVQALIPANTWFGAFAHPEEGGFEHALIGCTVAPGFDFEDFELAKRSSLLAEYPECLEMIEKLTME